MKRAVVLLALLLAACQGRTSFFQDGGGARAQPAGGYVSLSARDLAPVDAYISARNAQWILGDEVEVLASREYFAQQLTVNTRIGMVERKDTTRPDATIVELRYRGNPYSASVETNPRVMIGTGLTITARQRITVRLQGTKDRRLPVVLSVRALGDASRGRKDEVEERAPELRLGGELRETAGRYQWTPYR